MSADNDMPTEQQILNLIRKVIPNSEKYLFDDAAIIAYPRQVRLRRKNNLVVTTDTLVENTHFTRKNYTPEEVGWKALAVNLSDIAAMGAKPLYGLVSLSLPKNTTSSWIKKLYNGINNCAKKFHTQIIGGNLARSKEINITITVIGKTITKSIGKRSNAKAGDLVFTTGSFGDSAAGLLALKHKEKLSSLVKAHKQPIPQIAVGQKIVSLAKKVALMDASDGLADCLIQISKESKVKIITEEDKILISQNTRKAVKALKKALNLALYGGEDYQLVGTASKADIKKLKKIKGIKIIGKVVNGKGAFLKQKNNKLVKLDMKKTYEHFK